jgi:hypothetical protein
MTNNEASDQGLLVELRGFEPLTPSMRTRCATGLRYSPRTGSQRSKYWRCFAPGFPVDPSLVAYGANGGIGVLVVQLISDPAGDVDDLGGLLGRLWL